MLDREAVGGGVSWLLSGEPTLRELRNLTYATKHMAAFDAHALGHEANGHFKADAPESGDVVFP